MSPTDHGLNKPVVPPLTERLYHQDDLKGFFQHQSSRYSSQQTVGFSPIESKNGREDGREDEQSSLAVEIFHKQVDLLAQRLIRQPASFRQIFIGEGVHAVAAEFQQDALSATFTQTFWQLLLRNDAMSLVLLRFVWDIPLTFKRKFIRAIEAHLADRYPMFAGLSHNWPAENHIPPYIRPAFERAKDFDLVNQGYLGYMGLGYSFREVELFVWLEVLRDRQCDDRPCEKGVPQEGTVENRGGCPVKIHIPEMVCLLGEGRFQEAFQLIRAANPLPNVTGRVCPQELQCQGVCSLTGRPLEIGQLEWYLPQSRKINHGDALPEEVPKRPDPWFLANKPPVAVVGSGPSGLINAYLLLQEGFPVTIFEAFHALGGVLRYGIPEFRLPNELIDDVVTKIIHLGGKIVSNFVVGKTATLEQLRAEGFWKIFIGTGAGLPRFANIPGEHLLGVMSANEFLTRINLMQGHKEGYETPVPAVKGKRVVVFGGGNTAMDAARTAKRLGGEVTIIYRRTRQEMPVRGEELHHALEEGVQLMVLRSPKLFMGHPDHHTVTQVVLDIVKLGEPDASGRKRPILSGVTELMTIDLAIMALANAPNPIIKDAEPTLKTTRWGTIEINNNSQESPSMAGVFAGGDATRGGSTAIKAAGDGQSAARQIIRAIPEDANTVREMVSRAAHYSQLGQTATAILKRVTLAEGIVELTIKAPLIAKSAQAGQFVRVLAQEKGELIPLTLADWDRDQGEITMVIQGMGTSTKQMNQMAVGDVFFGIAGPLGRASQLYQYGEGRRIIFVAGGVGLPPVYPIMREHLRIGNRVTLIAGFRSVDHIFWTQEDQRIGQLQAQYPGLLDIIYASNDGSFGRKGFVTEPLKELLDHAKLGVQTDEKNPIAEVIAIGPPMMMRAISDLSKPYGVRTMVSLNAIMVDATGMCGACMVPMTIDGKLVRKHACIDGPEFDAHQIDWDKFLPRFNQFKPQEQSSRAKHGF